MLKSTPTSKQRIGIKFISPKQIGILGFKTGVGKTITILAVSEHYLNKYSNLKCIVFGPKNAIERVWPVEIEKHTYSRFIKIDEVQELYKALGNLDFLSNYHYILVRYSYVIKYNILIEKLVDKNLTIYDESHSLKNPKAKMVAVLTLITTQVRCKWGLTATSILNSIMDLWGMMSFFDPTILGSEYDFKDTFCELKKKVIGYDRRLGRRKYAYEIVGYKNEELLKSILDKYILSMGQDIEVKFHNVPYTLTKEENEGYLLAAQGILEIKKDRKGFAQRLHDLQRVVDGSQNHDGEKELTRRSSKYNEYIILIKGVLEEGESAVVFAEYYYTLDMLKNLVSQDIPDYPIFVISGKEFNYPDKFPCVLIMTAGGGQSLNFKWANHVFFFSIPFSIGYFIQILGRITRMDSDYLDNLNCYVPKNDFNIDCYKYLLLDSNAAIINRLLGEDANLPTKEIEGKRRSLIEKMRKELLWKVKELRRVQQSVPNVEEIN